MPPRPEDTQSRSSAARPVTDLASLRDREGVEFHEDADVADREPFETLRDLDHLAVVGIENDDGEVLLRRLTEDCGLKLPAIPIEQGEDATVTARRGVEANLGLDLELAGPEAAWHYEARLDGDPDRVAHRYFVCYRASPAGDGTIPDDREAVEADWYGEFPDEAVALPGTDRFFD